MTAATIGPSVDAEKRVRAFAALEAAEICSMEAARCEIESFGSTCHDSKAVLDSRARALRWAAVEIMKRVAGR